MSRDQKVFRDPVQGDIFLSQDLVRLIDTRDMQRLRGIRQLGTAYFVYPGAVHTRFEHSLGTCAITGALLDILQEYDCPVNAAARRVILAAALVHDVGHIPFGHTIEDERRLFTRHDTPERLREVLSRGELGTELRRQKLYAPVCDVLLGQGEHHWWSELISGAFSADLLDYLARDAFFCGLPQRYDARIMRSVRVADDHLYLNAQRDGIVREDFVSELINLLRLRYFLTERVFFHHTKTASGAMVSRAVEQALGMGLTLEELYPITDERLLALLETRYARDSVVSQMMNSLASRRIYKRCYVLTSQVGDPFKLELVARYHDSIEHRRQAEEYLTHKLKLNPGDLIVYCPAAGMQLKEAEVRLKTGLEAPCSLAAMDVPEVNVLRQKHRNLWRFYVFLEPSRMSKARTVSRECEKFFGSENHLPGLQSPQMYMTI